MCAARADGECGRCSSPEMSFRRSFRARTEAQLPQATVELVHSRGASACPSRCRPPRSNGQRCSLRPHCPRASPIRASIPRSKALLDAIEAAPSASGWGAALVRYELLLLAELGFGLDLDRCAVTGSNDNLVAVSPKSGRAVSAAEAEPYAGKLLPLPAFVREGGARFMEEIAQGLDLTGHFLMRDVLTDRARARSPTRAHGSSTGCAARAVSPRLQRA